MLKIFLPCLLVFSACSTAKPAGIRSDFKNAKVDKIANMALFSTSHFSMEDGQFEKISALYENAITRQLHEMGFQIVARKSLESPMSIDEKSALKDGLGLPKSLDLLFEADHGEFGLEVQVVQSFHRAKALPSTLLFSEIVYHSQTTCRNSSASTRYAHIKNENIELPAKCIISHFHAKLVDSKTGKAMWNNRILVEHRYEGDIEAALNAAVIEDAVRGVLLGEHGIQRLK